VYSVPLISGLFIFWTLFDLFKSGIFFRRVIPPSRLFPENACQLNQRPTTRILIVANQHIHAVQNAIKKPLEIPVTIEPTNAVRTVLRKRS
jgi:hypothetical protein